MIPDERARIPQSRRERPSKPALTRDGIIDAALAILEEEGIGKVTMRRIAGALDTGPASLYVYVRNTEELHGQILDALLGRMTPISRTGSWRERLHELLTGYARVLFDYPEIARMTMTTRPDGPHYFALVESILALLAEGDVPEDRAAWGIDLLLAAVTTTALEHAGDDVNDPEAGDLSAMAASIAAASEKDHPHATRLGDEMISGTGPERFAWWLDVLVNGILSTPRP